MDLKFFPSTRLVSLLSNPQALALELAHYEDRLLKVRTHQTPADSHSLLGKVIEGKLLNDGQEVDLEQITQIKTGIPTNNFLHPPLDRGEVVVTYGLSQPADPKHLNHFRSQLLGRRLHGRRPYGVIENLFLTEEGTAVYVVSDRAERLKCHPCPGHFTETTQFVPVPDHRDHPTAQTATAY